MVEQGFLDDTGQGFSAGAQVKDTSFKGSYADQRVAGRSFEMRQVLFTFPTQFVVIRYIHIYI